jgi:uncharacterized protein YggT (Ycf19 family)
MVLLYRILRAFVWVLYALAIVAIVALAFSFVLALFGANQTVPFAKVVADLTSRFMNPFQGLIPPTPTGKTGVIIWSALIAIAAYAVAAWILSLLADWLTVGIERSASGNARRRQAQQPAVVQAPIAAGAVAGAVAGAPPVATEPPAYPVIPPVVQPVAPQPMPQPVAPQPAPMPAEAPAEAAPAPAAPASMPPQPPQPPVPGA